MKTILKRNNCEPGDEVQFADKYTHIWERSEFTDFKGATGEVGRFHAEAAFLCR